jgi:hypothetical protein
MSLSQETTQEDEPQLNRESLVALHLVIRYKRGIWCLGKRGVIPPLPRNCERGERERAEMQPLGFVPGKVFAVRRNVSQETGQMPIQA